MVYITLKCMVDLDWQTQLGLSWVGNVNVFIKHTRRFDSCLARVKMVKCFSLFPLSHLMLNSPEGKSCLFLQLPTLSVEFLKNVLVIYNVPGFVLGVECRGC